jgi:hypothetical protein
MNADKLIGINLFVTLLLHTLMVEVTINILSKELMLSNTVL